MTEFRGFPPEMRDELRAALGSELTVQESDWNCGSLITPNHQGKLVHVRVRRALALAIYYAPQRDRLLGSGSSVDFDLRQSV